MTSRHASTRRGPGRRMAAAMAMTLLGTALTVLSGPGSAAVAAEPGAGCGQAVQVAVNTADDNLYRWSRGGVTSGSWTAAGKVGTGWGGIRLTTVDDRGDRLFAVDTAGNMHLYTWAGSGYTGGTAIGNGWSDMTQILAAGNGVIYAVGKDGSLKWYQWLVDAAGKGQWDARSGQPIGSGWNGFSRVVSGGNGVLYGIRKSDGALLWYRNTSPGLGRADWTGPRQVGQGWGSMRAVVGLGGGVLYAVNSSGALLQYTNTGYLTGDATWGNNGTGVQIGSGWTGYDRITAAPDACAPPAPTRQNGVDTPVYFVHGIMDPTNPGWDCSSYWGTAVDRFRVLGWTGPLLTVKYYGADSHCDVTINNGGITTSIENLGKSLAWWIYQHNSVYGQPVQLVGHSMGGAVIRAAMTGVEQGWTDFPPYLYVTNVATMESPHNGSGYAGPCRVVSAGECTELAPDSPFLKSLDRDPQSRFGTDWTLLGVEDDDMVQWPSTLGVSYGHAGVMEVGHVIYYNGGQFGTPKPIVAPVHMSVLSRTGSSGYNGWHGEAYAGNAWNVTGEVAGPDNYGYTGFTVLSGGLPAPIDAVFAAVRYWETR